MHSAHACAGFSDICVRVASLHAMRCHAMIYIHASPSSCILSMLHNCKLLAQSPWSTDARLLPVQYGVSRELEARLQDVSLPPLASKMVVDTASGKPDPGKGMLELTRDLFMATAVSNWAAYTELSMRGREAALVVSLPPGSKELGLRVSVQLQCCVLPGGVPGGVPTDVQWWSKPPPPSLASFTWDSTISRPGIRGEHPHHNRTAAQHCLRIGQ